MGVKFSKEMIVDRSQIVPSTNEKPELTVIQEKLLKKLGPNAYPFTYHFPSGAPSSVTLQPGDEDTGKPLGVEHAIKTYVGDGIDEKGHKRSSVALAIKKVINSQARLFNSENIYIMYLCTCFVELYPANIHIITFFCRYGPILTTK